MPSLVILATADAALADAWERQLPPGRAALRVAGAGLPPGSAAGFAAVVVLDATAESTLPPPLARSPTIYVGEPRSLPFEQAKLAGRARVYLSYEESANRLREFLPLVEELAEKQSMVELLSDRTRRIEPPRPAPRPAGPESAELWDFFEGAVENLDSRERLLAEFRRASRHLLRASHVLFFVREADGFRADSGASFFPVDDPLVTFLENRPMVIDGASWDVPVEAAAELAVRNRLALWGARLLVPVHDNGRLLGLIAFGVRDDGQPYDEADHARSVFFARLLRHILGKSAELGRLRGLAEQARLGAKYLPNTVLLGPDETVPRPVPLVVRDLIGRTRRSKQPAWVAPGAGQPFRAAAGMVAETGGVWAYWQEAASEVHAATVRQHAERRDLLRELALTLSHELANPLVSLAMFRQTAPGQGAPAELVEMARRDVAKLETLNRDLGLMQMLHEMDAHPMDLRDLVQEVGRVLGIKVEAGSDPVVIAANRKLLEFALRALLASITENRGELGARELTVQLRSTGAGGELTALLSIKGRSLELEGILPEPAPSAVPNQGRLGVFLAKEILRLHHGEIHAGPGLEGTEILISLRSA
jgi:signal transduction histidine kinase